MNAFSVSNIIKELKLVVSVDNVFALPANCAYGVLDTSYDYTNFNNKFDAAQKNAMFCA